MNRGLAPLLAVMLATGFTSMPVAAQTIEEEGRFHVVWEDPPGGPGQASMHFFLADSQGRLSELELSPSLLRWIGDPMQLDGRAVRVRGRDQGLVAHAAAPRLIEIEALDPIVAPGIEGVEGAEAITGTFSWVTVLCKFPDLQSEEPHPAPWYAGLLEGSGYPTIDHYWQETSYERLSTAGSRVVGWYTLPEPRDVYVNSSGLDLEKLRDDCAAEADAEVYYPEYDGISFQFNASIGGASWGGRNSVTLDGVHKRYGMTWMAEWADQYAYAHEQGHGLGLPHSSGPYSATYDSNWDVMSGARNYRDATYGWIAPHTIAIHKEQLGWIPSTEKFAPTLGTTETVELDRLADSPAPGSYLILGVPLPDGTIYTIESRRFHGYDENLPGQAVIIHHVDPYRIRPANLVDADGDGDPDDDGVMWTPGEVFTDASIGLEVRIDAETARGHRVTVSFDDGGTGPVPDPVIALTPTSLAYETPEGTDPASKSFTVRNDGGGTLSYTLSANRTWLGLSRSSGDLGAGASQSVTVSVDASGLAVGSHSGTVTVNGNGTNAPQTVAVSVTVTAPPSGPVITTSPSELNFQVKGNKAPGSQTLEIRNDGAEALTWTASASQPWLSVGTSSGTLSGGSAASVSVEVAIADLSAGTYDGEIVIAGNADNAPQTVPVQLKMTKGGVVKIKKGRMTFAGSTAEQPLQKYVQLENDGDDSAVWTAVADQPWITLGGLSGTLEVGATYAVSLDVDISTLPPGYHAAQIEFAGGDDGLPDTLQVELMVADGPGVRQRPEQAAAHLLGASQALTESELDYLDFAGNGDGQFDVGDLRAWLIQAGELGPDALLLDVQPAATAPTSTTTGTEDLPAPGREPAERRER